MPIKGARYRVKTTKTGKKVRLAFRDGKVVEAKNLKTGATHTPSEFKQDRKKKNAKKKSGTKRGRNKAKKGRRS